jgi:hypothetical protein
MDAASADGCSVGGLRSRVSEVSARGGEEGRGRKKLPPEGCRRQWRCRHRPELGEEVGGGRD